MEMTTHSRLGLVKSLKVFAQIKLLRRRSLRSFPSCSHPLVLHQLLTSHVCDTTGKAGLFCVQPREAARKIRPLIVHNNIAYRVL